MLDLVIEFSLYECTLLRMFQCLFSIKTRVYMKIKAQIIGK